MNVVAFAPPIAWALVPSKVNVLVPASSVPLFEKAPLTAWEKVAALNVEPAPSVKAPFTVRAAAAVAVAVPGRERLPTIVGPVAGRVFTPLPLRLRWPYVSLETVWLAPP